MKFATKKRLIFHICSIRYQTKDVFYICGSNSD